MSGTDVHRYYDTYWRSEDWATAPPLKVLELLDTYMSTGDRALDVGCGDGGTTGAWLNENTGGYVGVDISESAVQMARDRGLDARVIADAADLPFTDESFDAAVCVEVLEHLFEPQRALGEINRVLGPRGRLIVTVPNAAHWRNRLDLGLLGRWNPRGDQLSASEPWRDPHIRFFTLASLAALLDSSGFAVVESGGFSEHGFLYHLPGLRSLARSSRARPTARRVAAALPGLLAGNLYAVGRVQDPRDAA